MTPTAEAAYLFRHPLMRDGAYQVMPPSIRAHLHTLAADALEAGGAAPPEIAEHLMAAVALTAEPPANLLERERAACWSGGQWLVSQARPHRALELFARAAHSPAASDAQRADAVHAISQTSEETGLYAVARTLLGEILAADPGGKWPAARTRALRAASMAAMRLGDSPGTVRLAQEAIAMAQSRGDEDGLERALAAVGSHDFIAGRTSEAAAAFQRAAVYGARIGDRAFELRMNANLASIDFSLGRHASAETRYLRAIADGEAASDGVFTALARLNFAAVLDVTGRGAEAIAMCKDLLETARRTGNRLIELRVLGRLALSTARVQGGDLALAESYAIRGVAIAREIGSRYSEGSELGTLGRIHRLMNRHAEALMEIQQALAIHRETRNVRFTGIHSWSLGCVLADLGQLGEAAQTLRGAIDLLRQSQEIEVERDATGELIRVLRRLEPAALHAAEIAARETRLTELIALAGPAR